MVNDKANDKAYQGTCFADNINNDKANDKAYREPASQMIWLMIGLIK